MKAICSRYSINTYNKYNYKLGNFTNKFHSTKKVTEANAIITSSVVRLYGRKVKYRIEK